MFDELKNFLKKESVLCIATVLAVVSMFFVQPDAQYASYIDVRVLALLFCLMIVMAGLRELGVFYLFAQKMLKKAKGYRQICTILIFLCFFSSMVITNDVALITFVPFTITLFTMADLKEKMISVIVLETIAANLGSMLTPIGNPQNLYLYGISEMAMSTFLAEMLPLTVASFTLLAVCCFFQKNRSSKGVECLTKPEATLSEKSTNRMRIGFYVILFAVSLLSVFRVIPYIIPLCAAVAGALFLDRQVLKKADYSLILTFISFFIFIGNMGRIEGISAFLSHVLHGRELLTAFVCSQFISNVPAAVLLSEFTSNWGQLLRGVNIGGLGTLIASMASLISYKFFVEAQNEKKGQYLKKFVLSNAGFAGVLLLVGLV